MLSRLLLLSTIYVWPSVAQLPYNPVRLILSPDKSKVYQFSPQASPSVFAYLDISKQITSSSAPVAFGHDLPFSVTDQAFVPITDSEGITAVVGGCQDSDNETELWRLSINKDGKDGAWKKLGLGTSDTSLSANYLSAGFTFSVNGSIQDTSFYLFGGMCPSGQSNATDWVSQATYSNSMLSVQAANDQSTYQVSAIGTRSTPISEAGLTITPLTPGSTKTSAGQVAQSQNFVLVGGHTQSAFINMSQVALFSLPEASWSYVGVTQPPSTAGELVRREAASVEPRSGHTAVLTEDGTKIIVFGGWVGDVTNPAAPQLAVLTLGQGYGGTASWEWSIPKQTSNPMSSGLGLYGHGAVMLPGNIMMIAGGTNIGTSKQKRSTQSYMFYDANSGAWSTTYKNSHISDSGLDTTQKAGLGAGLGLGLIVLAVVLVVWWFYRRKLNAKRAEREARLRELAFGSERYQSSSRLPSRMEGRFSFSEMRSASWGSRQEHHIEGNGFKFPWGGLSHAQADKSRDGDIPNAVERTALEVPSPTRGLRKSLSGRGTPTFGNMAPAPVVGPGSVFRIDEVEEEGSIKSLPARTNADSRLSDPFKDPPNLEPDPAAAERKREVKGWVEDWQSAAVEMNLSRNPSHARTYSNLSQSHSTSECSSYKTGRESPDKSDRTGSNLSERSAFSIQKSTGMVSRQPSQRSVSAGYALFAGAAAAMGRLGGANKESALERTASKRSVSLHTGPPRRGLSGSQRQTSRETRSLLRDTSPTKSTFDEPPIKDYKNYARTSSMTSEKRKMGILGSVKRVFTGTSSVNVQAAVEHYEEKVDDIPPTRADSEMAETPTSPAFWRSKRGAKDWDEDDPNHPYASSTKGHRRSTIEGASSVEDYDGEDWDVETAVQKRVVQVMFTMPKEKLRVVNADALSLISRSDTDEKEDRDRKGDLARMDSVKEDADADADDRRNEKGKGKMSVV